MKTNKGISLVALIITIIVMVILAGIIIVSAVSDGGVIDRTQKAMKENERAEVEDLVIASYVYKTTASTSSVGYLNLEETAKAIYLNLTDNNFKLKTPAGEEATSYEGIYLNGATSINLNVEGKRGNYGGTVEKTGLKDGMKIVEKENLQQKDDEITDEKLIQDLQSKEVGDKYELKDVEYIIADKDDTRAILIATHPLGSVTIGANDSLANGNTAVEKAIDSINKSYDAIQEECERVTSFSTLPQSVINISNIYIIGNTPGKPFYGTIESGMTSGCTSIYRYYLENCYDGTTDAWCSNLSMYYSSHDWPQNIGLISLPTQYTACSMDGMNDFKYGETYILNPINNDTNWNSIKESSGIGMNLPIPTNAAGMFESATTSTKGVIPVLTINLSA